MSAYEVGQMVYVYSLNARVREPERGTVVKIGRKLVTVETGDGWKQSRQFRIDDGSYNSRDWSSHHWIRTEAQRDEDDRRTAAELTLRDNGLPPTRCKLPTPTLEAIAALIVGDIAERESSE